MLDRESGTDAGSLTGPVPELVMKAHEVLYVLRTLQAHRVE